jgi:hypothetical protein
MPGQAPKSMAYADLDQSLGSVPGCSFGEYQMFGLRDDEDVFAEFISNGGEAIPESDWKAHVSILATQLAQAWDVIYPLLSAARVHHFKVARQSALRAKAKRMAAGRQGTAHEIGQGIADLNRVSLGMQVTVWMPRGGEARMQDVLKQVENKLRDAKIMPGEMDRSDRPLGRYCSIRNACSSNGYLTHDQVSGYNPSGALDPFRQTL